MRYNAFLGDVDVFVEQHQRLVWNCVQRFIKPAASKGIEADDLFQVGCIGLLRAYEKFDPDNFTGVTRFSTYGVPMIIGEIRRFLRDYNSVKVSRSYRGLLKRIKDENLLGLPVSEIAIKFDVSEKSVEEALRLQELQITSMDATFDLKDDSESLSLHDQIPSNVDYTGISVYEFLGSLSEREQKIAEMLMDGKVQQEIASVLGISQVQVSRLLKKIRRKYQEYYEGEGVMGEKKKRVKLTRGLYESMVRQGKSDKEIAVELGYQPTTITYYRKKWEQEDKQTKEGVFQQQVPEESEKKQESQPGENRTQEMDDMKNEESKVKISAAKVENTALHTLLNGEEVELSESAADKLCAALQALKIKYVREKLTIVKVKLK